MSAEALLSDKLEHVAEAERAHADQRPHLMHLGVGGGPRVKVTCPGPEHCPLWYSDTRTGFAVCGFQAAIDDYGYEMLEYHIGPEFWPITNPFPVRFTWTHCGENEPVEIEWWPVPQDGVVISVTDEASP